MTVSSTTFPIIRARVARETPSRRGLKDDESGEHGTDGVPNSRDYADNRVQSDAELGPGDLERVVQQPRQELEPFDLRRSGGHDGYRRRPMQRVCHG